MTARICRWQDMERWTPDGGASWDAAFPTVPLGEVLRLRRQSVTSEQFHKYQPITIHFGGSIVARDRTEPFKGAMFAAYPGDLVYSKIDVRNGAIGLVPSEFSRVVVTSEYPVHFPDRKQVDGRYLALLLRTPNFLHLLKGAASGTSGRKRVGPESFEDLEIPLPEPTEQKRLIDAYEAVLSRAAKMEAEAAAIEQRGLRAFEAALGLTPPLDLPRRLLQIKRYQDVERWSHEGILQTTLLGENRPETRFDGILLEDVAKVSYGIQKCPTNRPGTHARPYLRVANVQRGYLDLEEIKHINVSDEDMPKYALQEGDVLLCEGNSADLVGRGAIWLGEIPNCVHQNHVLRVRVYDRGQVLPELILEYMNSSSGQAYFRSKAKRTTNLASINSKEVAEMPLPLPKDIKIQKAILDALRKTQKQALRKREEAKRLRDTAWDEFLAAVFQ